MDLSCLKPYLKAIYIVKTREFDKVNEKQRDTVTLPDTVFISMYREACTQMSLHVIGTVHKDEIVQKTLLTSKDVSCRGSPLIRSP